MWAVIPLKDFAGAKQRLAELLSQGERQGLFRAMAEDVLAAASAAPGLDGVAALTRDPEAAALCRRYGIRVLSEPANRGHTAAVESGAAQLAAEGVSAVLTFPGDIPFVTAAEIGEVAKIHRASAEKGAAMTIVPSGDKLGSNGVALSPPGAVPLRFGSDSFYPHLAAARACGIEPVVVELPGFAHDVDTPDDLRALLARGARNRTAVYLAESGLAARLAPRKILAAVAG